MSGINHTRVPFSFQIFQENLQDEVIELAKVTIHQNYFESNNMFWQQDSGTPMGSPISSILAEILPPSTNL
jgi:hypothetical protein